LALDAGEPYRIARALAAEAMLVALEGGPRRWRRAEDLGAEAERLAERIANPHALAWAMSAAAVTAWAQAEWRRAQTGCDFAIALFRERCVDIGREVASLDVLFNLTALLNLGEVGELERRAPAVLEDAEARGDRYASTSLRSHVLPLLHLAAGRRDEARAAIAAAREGWSVKGWHLQHWGCAISESELALYEGRGAEATAALAAAWPRMLEARQLDMQNLRVQTLSLRGRLALQAGRPGDAMEDARRLEGERASFARAPALMLRAGAAVAEGDPARAARIYGRAETAFAALGMRLCALAARRRRGELGEAAQIAAADEGLAAAGVAVPERMVALLAPTAGV
jgi:ATP/maltotriose-dependent transcriptional regulator MalT